MDQVLQLKEKDQDFPGGSVVRILCFHYQGHGFKFLAGQLRSRKLHGMPPLQKRPSQKKRKDGEGSSDWREKPKPIKCYWYEITFRNTNTNLHCDVCYTQTVISSCQAWRKCSEFTFPWKIKKILKYWKYKDGNDIRQNSTKKKKKQTWCGYANIRESRC